MIGMTPTQAKVRWFIIQYMKESGGVSPSYGDIGEALFGGRNKARRLVSSVLDGLEERGHIRRIPGRARAIEVLPQYHLGKRVDLKEYTGEVDE